MFSVVGLRSGAACVLLGFVFVSDKDGLNDTLKKVFVESVRWGCWRVEAHLFAMGFKLEDVIASTRDAILSNIHLSLVLYHYEGLSDIDRVLSDIVSRIESGSVRKVYIYVSPGINRDAVEKVRSKIPSAYSVFLS